MSDIQIFGFSIILNKTSSNMKIEYAMLVFGTHFVQFITKIYNNNISKHHKNNMVISN